MIGPFFKTLKLKKKIMSGVFLPYKFIGDAAYPMRPWFYSPFKGEKEGLSKSKVYWNFIQSSTRTAIEKAFGIVKGRWRILLNIIDLPLKHVPDLVIACICLHNLCIIHGDKFDMQWAKEAENVMEAERDATFRQLKSANVFHSAIEGIASMREVQGLQQIN